MNRSVAPLNILPVEPVQLTWEAVQEEPQEMEEEVSFGEDGDGFAVTGDDDG